jgi:threonyl-tRNA synthetase
MQCAHIMAMAVQRLHKDAQVTIGPWIDRGFYYDFDLATPLSDKELKAIRKEMQKIIRMNLPFIREEVRMAAGAQMARAVMGQQWVAAALADMTSDGHMASSIRAAGTAVCWVIRHDSSSITQQQQQPE